jgi:hypothetical protein
MTRTGRGKEEVRATIAALSDSISDQLPHLEVEDHARAVYAGRYVDGAWRTLELGIDRWVAAFDAELGMPTDDLRDVGEVLMAARDAPALVGIEDPRGTDVAGHLRAVASLCARLEGGLADGDGHEVCVAAHLMRRSFSAYRVAKYRWLESSVEDGLFTPASEYDWLEF